MRKITNKEIQKYKKKEKHKKMQKWIEPQECAKKVACSNYRDKYEKTTCRKNYTQCKCTQKVKNRYEWVYKRQKSCVYSTLSNFGENSEIQRSFPRYNFTKNKTSARIREKMIPLNFGAPGNYVWITW
jgi:hypothetical protein